MKTSSPWIADRKKEPGSGGYYFWTRVTREGRNTKYVILVSGPVKVAKMLAKALNKAGYR